MNQGEKIINYIRQFGSISPLEAFRDLGITKLATRISEMNRDGIDFQKQYVKSKNRFGETVYYMRYSMRD
jgi:hypothetical protein